MGNTTSTSSANGSHRQGGNHHDAIPSTTITSQTANATTNMMIHSSGAVPTQTTGSSSNSSTGSGRNNVEDTTRKTAAIGHIKRDQNNDDDDDDDDDTDNNYNNNKDDDCQFPCFLFFTPRQIPFLKNHHHNHHPKNAFGSPLPDTPVMERRRRQEITQQATSVFQREQQQNKNYTVSRASSSTQQQQHHHQRSNNPYPGLEREETESSRSFRLPNLIPPSNHHSHHRHHSSSNPVVTNGAVDLMMTPPQENHDSHSLLLRSDHRSHQSHSTTTTTTTNAPPPYPEAEIYEGDDCEEQLYEKYELCEVLGVGSTSTVHRCIHKATGNEYACKIIDIQNMDVQYHSMMIQFHTEITSLKSIHHPGIIQLYDVYILSTIKIYIVMELMLGGELFDYVVEKGTLSEEEASQIVRTVLSAIHYLHTHSIIHRDLKPENLLLKYKPNTTITTTANNNTTNQKHNHATAPVDVKIIDFGLSKLLTTDDTVASTFLGTRGYLAPEMLQRREYTSAVDTWAMGVIVYVLLCGCLPFDDDVTMIIHDDTVVQKRFVLRFPRWAKNLSPSAKDLLNHLLDINPFTRYTAQQALHHPWVRGETAPSKNLLASPGRIRKSPANTNNNKSQNQRNNSQSNTNASTKNYLGRKYAPDPCSLTPPTPRVRKGSF